MGDAVQEIYTYALALMYENLKNTKDYDQYLIPMMNILLAENFELNNNNRKAYGKEPLTEIPKVTAKSDIVPYEPIFCRQILPLGLAASFFVDDSMNKHADYFAQYNNARVSVERAVITSYYSNDEEE